MEKKILGLVIFVLILIGFLTFIYFKFEPKTQSKEFSNISISAESEKKKIVTGFLVNGESGNTTEYYQLVTVPKGEVKIENVNLPGQYYYKDTKLINASQNQIRIDLKLEEVKPLQINITRGNPINLTVSSGDFRDLMFCLKGSLNYIFIKSNYSEISKLKGYESWDKCYSTKLSLKNSYINIPVSYEEFGILTDADYINISLITPEFLGIKDKILKIT